jgi:hypothetical protein
MLKITTVPSEKPIKLMKCPYKLRMKNSAMYSPVAIAEFFASEKGFVFTF